MSYLYNVHNVYIVYIVYNVDNVYYVNDVLQDFSGTGNSYDFSEIYEGMGSHGFNFVRLKIVDKKCKLERIGRGYYTYESKYSFGI